MACPNTYNFWNGLFSSKTMGNFLPELAVMIRVTMFVETVMKHSTAARS